MLSAVTRVWDYEAIATELAGWSMMQNPVPSLDEPDDIVHIKLVPIDAAGRVFEDVVLTEVKIITVVQVAPTRWRVWGLAQNRAPSAATIRGTAE